MLDPDLQEGDYRELLDDEINSLSQGAAVKESIWTNQTDWIMKNLKK